MGAALPVPVDPDPGLEVHPRAEELLGTRDDEIQMVDDDQAAFIDQARTTLTTTGRWSGKYRIRRPDGEIRQIRAWSSRFSTAAPSGTRPTSRT